MMQQNKLPFFFGRGTNNSKRVYDKYLRFWGLMDLLHKSETVNKRMVVVNLFNQNAEELEVLLAANIISYVNEKFPDSMGKKSDSIFSLLNSSLDSVALSAGK
jgi:hypothetical protein